MSTQQDRTTFEQPELTEQDVADYLRSHPEFFQNNPSLLAQLELPHECAPAVSLIEYQVRILRDQNRQMKRKLKELVQVGRDNDRLNEHMLQLTMELIGAESLGDVLNALEQSLQKEFKADAVAVRLFEHAALSGPDWAELVVSRDDPGLESFEHFLKTSRPLCGRLQPEQLSFLFGDQASKIESAVLTGLGSHADLGMLAIGSADPARFHPGMGTLFLNRMSALVSAALRRHLGESP